MMPSGSTEPSVGSVGDRHHTALAETINGPFKAEVIHRRGSLNWPRWLSAGPSSGKSSPPSATEARITGSAMKPGQKCLGGCVLKTPKWAEISDNPGRDVHAPARTTVGTADAADDLEKGRKIHQYRLKPRSLGKYRIDAISLGSGQSNRAAHNDFEFGISGKLRILNGRCGRRDTTGVSS